MLIQKGSMKNPRIRIIFVAEAPKKNIAVSKKKDEYEA